MTKKLRWFVGGLVLLGTIFGFLMWNAAPRTLEARMLGRTAALLDAVDAGDRLAMLKLTLSEQGGLEDTAARNSSDDLVGTIRLAPGLSSSTEPLEIYDAWDWRVLGDLSSRMKAPVSYGVDTDPFSPSIAFSFNCKRARSRCLEHVVFFFTARAEKIESYSQFWNESLSRELWNQTYRKGRISTACDARCPRFDGSSSVHGN